MDRSRRLGRFFGLALLLHAACWLALHRHGPALTAAVSQAAPPTQPETLEVELLEPLGQQLTVETGPANPPPRLRAARLPGGPRAPEHSAPELSGAGLDASPELAADDVAQPPPPLLTREQLGIGEANPWLEPRPGAPRKNNAQARLQRSLRQAAAARDQELGMGPAGPILSALHGVALRELRAVNSVATLVATIDSQGNLIGLDVGDVNADREGWQRVASKTLAALRGKKLLARTGHDRTRLTLRVESREALPSGAAPGPEVSLFGQTIKKGGGKRAHKIDILKPEIALETVEIPGADGRPIKLPQLRVGFIVFGAPFEPADWGAQAQRVVSARVDKVDLLPEPEPVDQRE